MSRFSFHPNRFPHILPATLLTLSLSILTAKPADAQSLYNPSPLPDTGEVTDALSDKDIPTGFGGFARDYVASLEPGDHIVIDLASEEFDTIVTLIAPDGSTFGENDDGPDGSTNSLLFARIVDGGNYIVRVRPYGGQGLGTFNLKLTRLRPVN